MDLQRKFKLDCYKGRKAFIEQDTAKNIYINELLQGHQVKTLSLKQLSEENKILFKKIVHRKNRKKRSKVRKATIRKKYTAKKNLISKIFENYAESRRTKTLFGDNPIFFVGSKTKIKLDRPFMVNKVNGLFNLTVKTGLANCLKRCYGKRYTEYHPETHFISKIGREVFASSKLKDSLRNGSVWIVKPAFGARSVGIFFHIQSKSDPKKSFERLSNSLKSQKADIFVIQKYITDPFLYHNRKIDVRCYILIACTTPRLIAFYHRGHVRVASEDFSLSIDSFLKKNAHITNGSRGRKNAHYDKKTDLNREIKTRMEFSEFLEYYEENKMPSNEGGLDADEVEVRLKNILVKALESGQEKLMKHAVKGQFDLIGADILIQKSGQPVLLEIQYKPAISFREGWVRDLHKRILKEYAEIIFSVNKGSINKSLENNEHLKEFGFEMCINKKNA